MACAKCGEVDVPTRPTIPTPPPVARSVSRVPEPPPRFVAPKFPAVSPPFFCVEPNATGVAVLDGNRPLLRVVLVGRDDGEALGPRLQRQYLRSRGDGEEPFAVLVRRLVREIEAEAT